MNAPSAPPVADLGAGWDLLTALCMLRAQLWVGGQGKPAAGLSVILAVKADDGWLLLDPLRNATALNVGEAVYFDTQVEGRRLRFECRLDRIAQLEDGPAYLMTEPRLVMDVQRRVAYRVRVPDHQVLRAAIVDGQGQVRNARVLDLSHLGCAVRMEAAVVIEADTAVQCSLRVGEVQLTTEAEVRHARATSTGQRLGIEFKPSTPAVEQQLAQAVTSLQRQMLRGRGGQGGA